MFNFEYPWALLLLLAGALFFWNTTLARALTFSSQHAGKKIPRLGSVLANLPNICVAIALLLAPILLANPLGEVEQEMKTALSYRVVAIIDKSGSMAMDDKMTLARKATVEFFNKRKNDLAAILPFDDNALFAAGTPFTTDREYLLETTEKMLPDGGSTAIGTAILGGMWLIMRDVYVTKRMGATGRTLPSFIEVRNTIAAKDSEDVAGRNKYLERIAVEFGDMSGSFIVVVTDGESNTGVPPDIAIDFVAGLRIPIYVIGIGKDVQARPPFAQKLSDTGGEYFHSGNLKDIGLMYERIDKLKPTETKSGIILVPHSYRNELVALIILLLALATIARASFLVIE